MRNASFPRCGALPVIAPISVSRERAYCSTLAYHRCPHMVAVTNRLKAAVQEEQNHTGARGVAREVLISAFWILAIPTTLTIIIVLALFLTTH
ncbi:MAG: hypothetical protein WBW04_22135 [Nitrolancea sp.]